MLKKEKEERENRIRERIEKTMNASKLPPRMQMYADEMKKENEDNESTRSKSSTYKFKANKVPDFAKLQEEFDKFKLECDEIMQRKKNLIIEFRKELDFRDQTYVDSLKQFHRDIEKMIELMN